MHMSHNIVFVLLLLAGTAAATAALIVLMRPLLQRYALARPNARSSHAVPTAQGGGIAVMIAVVAVVAASALHDVPGFREPWVAALLAAAVILAAVGVIDDIRPLPVTPRLLLQLAAAGLMVFTLPEDARVLPLVGIHVERAILVLGLVWFINLTNFMDGIDGMTVAEMVPVCAALTLLGITGMVPALGTVLPVVLSLLGAMLGFAPFNRHVARLFLGDVGSLPVGALVGWLLILLASAGHLVAALILPLYYLSDATITLARRALRGENLAEAHRSHFYQIATTRGFTVPQVTTRVLVLNVCLAALTVAAVAASRSALLQATCLVLAAIATATVLVQFERGRTK